MQAQLTLPIPRQAASLHVPRLSRRGAFWAVAFAFLSVSAFSTAPSALYGLYSRHDHLDPLTLTYVYAVYAAGVTVSLLLAGHVSDWYGRKVVLIPAMMVAVAASLLFVFWQSLAPGNRQSARALPEAARCRQSEIFCARNAGSGRLKQATSRSAVGVCVPRQLTMR